MFVGGSPLLMDICILILNDKIKETSCFTYILQTYDTVFLSFV